jgi:putative ABC transport system permease protein
MRQWHRLHQLLRTIFRPHAVERELDEELRNWVDILTERYQAAGLSPEAARRAALLEMGSADRIKEEVRGLRNGSQLEALSLDVRYAWRGLWKARGLTAIIVITLALGIGANTAIFSIVRAMLLQPLPYRNADRLAFVWADLTASGYPRAPLNGPELADLREGSATCSDFAGIWSNTAGLTGDGDPEQLRIGLVTVNFFQVLGAESGFGRTFRKEDGEPGATATILLGWDLFERRFGGDPSVVGRMIVVNDQPTLVIGIMPKDFRLLLPPDSSVPDRLQAWQALPNSVERRSRQSRFLRVVARLRPEVTIASARDDIAGIASRISRQTGTERAFTVMPLQADDVREIRGPLLALFAGVGILLMIACVNVAGLLIARAATRARETAVRMALGASRARLLQHALAEGLLLTMLGAALGIFAGDALLRLLLMTAPGSLSRIASSKVDLTVFAFTLGISVLWGLLFSLASMSELVRSAGTSSLRLHARTTVTPMRYRARVGLMVLQIGLSVVLLVSAGLLVRTLANVMRVDVGFRADRQWTFRISIPGQRYETQESVNSFAAELHRGLAALPGVSGVGAISHVPFDDLPNWGLAYSLQTPIPEDAPNADVRAIAPGLFESLGVRLIDGRFFKDEDQNPNHPVAIIDNQLAQLLWPNRPAVGQQFVLRRGAPDTRVTVIGVVQHLKLRSLVDDLTAQIYLPWPSVGRNPMAHVVKIDGDPAGLEAGIRRIVSQLDPRLPIYDLRPMDAYVESALSARRFTVLVGAAFALCALVLTCVGVYGIFAHAVENRRHEFGVRRALGAKGRDVMREVLREALGCAAVGCAVGVAGAVIAGRLLETQLFAVHPRDPVSYGVALALILAGAAVACWLPTRRAMRISPLDAMRAE